MTHDLGTRANELLFCALYVQLHITKVKGSFLNDVQKKYLFYEVMLRYDVFCALVIRVGWCYLL